MAAESTALGFGAAALLGLGFGAGPCNIACLPYLGPVLLASGSRAGTGWRVLLPFALGRLLGYTLLGLAAGLAGTLAGSALPGAWVHQLLGLALVLVAAGLYLRRRQAAAAAPGAGASAVRVAPPRPAAPLLPGGLFLLGLSMALNPCAPLGSVMLAAAAAGSAAAGLLLGLGFGLGAVLLPSLLLGVGLAHLGHQILLGLGRRRLLLERLSLALLAAMGIGTALGWSLP